MTGVSERALGTVAAGGVTAITGGITTTEWLAIIGAIVTVLGFLVQLWATYRRDQREQKLAEVAIRRAELTALNKDTAA